MAPVACGHHVGPLQDLLADEGTRPVRPAVPAARDQPGRGDPRGHARGLGRRARVLSPGDDLAGRAGHHRLRLQRPDRRPDGPHPGAEGHVRCVPGLDARPDRRRRDLRGHRAVLRVGHGGAAVPRPEPGGARDGCGHVVCTGQGRPPRLRRQGRQSPSGPTASSASSSLPSSRTCSTSRCSFRSRCGSWRSRARSRSCSGSGSCAGRHRPGRLPGPAPRMGEPRRVAVRLRHG